MVKMPREVLEKIEAAINEAETIAKENGLQLVVESVDGALLVMPKGYVANLFDIDMYEQGYEEVEPNLYDYADHEYATDDGDLYCVHHFDIAGPEESILRPSDEE